MKTKTRKLELERLEERCTPSNLGGKGDGDASGIPSHLFLTGALTVSTGPYATEQATMTAELTSRSGGTMQLKDASGGELDAVFTEMYQGVTSNGILYFRETYRVTYESGFFANAQLSGGAFFRVDPLPPPIEMPGIVPLPSSHYTADLY